MDNLHKLGVNTWLRFVDETFVTVGNINQVKTILDYLNSLHDKIKFTFEVESDNCLSFLDIIHLHSFFHILLSLLDILNIMLNLQMYLMVS